METRASKMNPEPKLWMVAERAVRLPNALIAAETLRDRFPGGVELVHDQSNAWHDFNWGRYASYFDRVYTFPRLKTCRGVFDLPRLYRQTLDRKCAIAALPINPETDCLLCIAGVLGLSLVAASAHSKPRKVLTISTASYERLTRIPDRKHFRFSTASWLQNRFIEPLAGLERTVQMKPRRDSSGDGARLVRLEKDPREIFDRILVSSISGRELPSGDERFVAARYPSMAEVPVFSRAREDGAPRRVLFFGSPFLLVRNLAPEAYVAHLNRCLDYIRRFHPDRELIYRPHPFETDEAQRLELRGFRVEGDRQPAEIYFLENFHAIEAVYSVSSTVSRRGLTMGLNAYSFWRCFPFPDRAAQFFARLMGDVPAEFEIRDFDRAPVSYQAKRQAGADTRTFSDALIFAFDSLTTRVAARR
ncbi:MAG TPA: hypothetical protein VEH26_04810 [Chthoniobacterales bacterium]|nr:hypothetical protein [Chthoniobacterales bacterium]